VEGAGEEEAEISGSKKETIRVLHSLNHDMGFLVIMTASAIPA
jgi:hypothetical protein